MKPTEVRGAVGEVASKIKSAVPREAPAASADVTAREATNEGANNPAGGSANDLPPWQARPWEKYRLQGQMPLLRAEGNAPEANPFYLDGDDAQAPQSDGAKRRKARDGETRRGKNLGRDWLRTNLPETIMVALALIGLSALVISALQTNGVQNTAFLTATAIVPLALVTFVFCRLDKWAPMPRRYLVVAFLWGAGVSTLLAMYANTYLSIDAAYYTGDETLATTIIAVAVAPVTEEACKGIGVAIILLAGRRFVVSSLNGVTVGVMVGGGFAFVENIQYFMTVQSGGTVTLAITIFLRGVMSPFIHPMATSFIGLFLGVAILRAGGWWAWTWRVTCGQLCAMAVHALWNGLASFGIAWYALYFLVEVPVFIVWIFCLQRTSNRQLQQIATGLQAYLATGWVVKQEVDMACFMPARKHARKWARKIGREARRAVCTFLVNAGRLGLDQVRMGKTGQDLRRMEQDRVFLAELVEARRTFMRLGAEYAQNVEGR